MNTHIIKCDECGQDEERLGENTGGGKSRRVCFDCQRLAQAERNKKYRKTKN